VEPAKLVGLSAVERDALGILAEADEAEAKVRLVSLLVEVEPHQWPSDAVGEPRADGGVEKRRPDHVAGHGDGDTAERDVQRTRERPEDGHEGDQGHRGPQTADREREAPGDEEPNVVGDALVGVVALASRKLRPVIGAIRQPGAKVPIGEPPSPLDQRSIWLR
jgi:hypothetical protein